MSALDRVGLLGRGKRKIVPVHLPGGDVAYVRSWTERERTDLENKINAANGKDDGGFRRRVLVKGLCSEAGERLFKDEEEDALGELDAVDAILLFDKSWGLAGFNAAEVAELEKNSDAAPAAS